MDDLKQTMQTDGSGEQKITTNLQWLRVYLLDELVCNSGKQLTPALIGDVTSRVVDLMKDKI